MRTAEEMMKLILDVATNDERIRAVTMEGSRASKNATHDQYCDFDISYVVKDIREFTKDNKWIEIFGEILIVQCPMDWYNSPYDYEGRDDFAYLIQFKDGNRIDLTLRDCSNIEEQRNYDEPRVVLLNKDNFRELKPISDESVFYIQEPSEMEYYNTCNEFRWLSVYISKGLCREELYYAKYAYDVLVMEMFIKMLNWKIGVDNEFKVTTGDHSKYLKRFLSSDELERFHGIFPNGTYEDIWNKLYVMYDYFAELAKYVGEALGYRFEAKETEEVRAFLSVRQKQKTELNLIELTDKDDILGTYSIYRHCMYLPTEEKFSKKIDAFLSDDSVKVFACLEQKELKGIIVVSFLEQCRIEIIGIAVDVTARSKGIGFFMIRSLVDEYGLISVFAETDDDAVEFYRKSGFEIKKLSKTYGDESVVRYQCELVNR